MKLIKFFFYYLHSAKTISSLNSWFKLSETEQQPVFAFQILELKSITYVQK